MKKIWSGFKGFLCNIKTLIYARLGELLSFAKKFLPFLTKAPLDFAKKALLLLTKAPLAFAKKALLFLTKAPLAFAKKTLSSLTKAPLAFAKKVLSFLTKAPLTFAKKVLFFRGAWLFCVKKYIYILFCLAVAMAVFGSSFLSCSPEFADQGSGNTNTAGNNNSGDDDDDDDPDETCDDNEGDPCKGNETCERVCEAIFEEYGEIRACINTGDETVDKLQKVHNLLMGKNAGVTTGPRTEVTRSPAEVEDDLNKIGEDDDEDGGVDRDAFRCYLEIGASKYITQIKKGLGSEGTDTTNKKDLKRKRLIKTLKWLVEDDKESAEILADVNAGDDILSAILESLAKTGTGNFGATNLGTSHCIAGNQYRANNSNTADNETNKDIWWISSSNVLVRYNKASTTPLPIGEIQLSNHDKNLYNALSCMHGEDMDNDNIFSYSAEHENQHIFNLAFEELSDICEDVKNKSAGQDKACARVLMCWTAWQNACGSSAKGGANGGTACPTAPSTSSDDKLWEMLDEHESALKESGDYKTCRTKDFTDFFP